jgi:dsDNA-binding SOS-regulon protein
MIDSPKERFEQLVRSGLELARNKEVATNILAMLFPKVDKIEPTFLPTSTNLQERRLRRRVSIADFSENYFTLTPDPDDWSQTEFRKIIEGSPEDAYATLARKTAFASSERQADLRRTFLELLEAEFSSRKKLSEAWLLTILDHSPEMLAEKDEERASIFTVSNSDRMRWLIQNGIEQLSIEERVMTCSPICPRL